jgi:hypothetical protein
LQFAGQKTRPRQINYRGKIKMANKPNVLLIVVIIAAVYLVFTSGILTPKAPAVNNGVQASCEKEDISFITKMTRMGVAGTSLSTATNNYFILTDKIGNVAAATTTTVSTNKDLQIMYGENSTSYYTVVKTINTDCSDPFYSAVELPMADTALNSFYTKNADGSVNSITVNQSMAANDVFETTVTIKAGSDTYFGNPTSSCKNIAVVEYDKTYFKSASGDSPTGVPSSFTYASATYDGSAAFYIPKSADGSEATFNVKLEASTSDPTGAYPILIVYDCDIDKDEDTLALIEGVDDEDGNRIALAMQNVTIYIS